MSCRRSPASRAHSGQSPAWDRVLRAAGVEGSQGTPRGRALLPVPGHRAGALLCLPLSAPSSHSAGLTHSDLSDRLRTSGGTGHPGAQCRLLVPFPSRCWACKVRQCPQLWAGVGETAGAQPQPHITCPWVLLVPPFRPAKETSGPLPRDQSERGWGWGTRTGFLFLPGSP